VRTAIIHHEKYKFTMEVMIEEQKHDHGIIGIHDRGKKIEWPWIS
jgi:hypothetical protein